MQNCNSKFKSDLLVRCYNFSLGIINLSEELPNKRVANIILNQLVRSATSIGANLVEGQAASSRLEFKKFYEISLKSANETKYWLGLLRDAKIIKAERIKTLLAEAVEISKMLAKGVMTLKGK